MAVLGTDGQMNFSLEQDSREVRAHAWIHVTRLLISKILWGSGLMLTQPSPSALCPQLLPPQLEGGRCCKQGRAGRRTLVLQLLLCPSLEDAEH